MFFNSILLILALLKIREGRSQPDFLPLYKEDSKSEDSDTNPNFLPTWNHDCRMNAGRLDRRESRSLNIGISGLQNTLNFLPIADDFANSVYPFVHTKEMDVEVFMSLFLSWFLQRDNDIQALNPKIKRQADLGIYGHPDLIVSTQQPGQPRKEVIIELKRMGLTHNVFYNGDYENQLCSYIAGYYQAHTRVPAAILSNGERTIFYECDVPTRNPNQNLITCTCRYDGVYHMFDTENFDSWNEAQTRVVAQILKKILAP